MIADLVAAFVKEHQGGRVIDNSLVLSPGEKEWRYQCVSLVKEYLRNCYKIFPGAWGHAFAYFDSTHSEILARFDRVQGEPRAGDVVVYPKSSSLPYGHIGIALNSTQMLEQNGGFGGGSGTGTDAVRIRSIFNGRSGLLRPKGGTLVSEEAAKEMYRVGLHREPENDQVWRGLVGMTTEQAARDMRQSEEWLSQNHAIVFFGRVQDQKNELEKRVIDLEHALAEGPGDNQDAEKKLKLIKDALGIK